MLDHLALDGFKSFAAGKRTEVPLGPLTLLVGPNASGKSNLLDAIRFLAGAGQDLPLGEVLRGRWEGGRELWPGLRGGATEATFNRGESFLLETRWFTATGCFSHELRAKCGDHPSVISESVEDLSWTYSELFNTHAPALGATPALASGGALPVWVKKDGKGPGKRLDCSNARSVLGQLVAEQLHPAVTAMSKALRAAMTSSMFLDLNAAVLREYAPKATTRLGSRGENLSAVLWHLCSANPEMRLLLVDWVSELCAPRVEGLDFVEVPDTGDVLAVLVEQGGVRITAKSMSDGTLRFLGMLAAAYSVEPGTTILLEEIENGLHPTRLHLLLELLDQVTTSRGIQVIATSHSPFALEALRPEVMAQALVFARHSDAEGTLVKPLGELPDFDGLVQKRGIEHLFRSGWLERAL